MVSPFGSKHDANKWWVRNEITDSPSNRKKRKSNENSDSEVSTGTSSGPSTADPRTERGKTNVMSEESSYLAPR